MKIYLLATNHSHQLVGIDNGKSQKLIKCLQNLCKQNGDINLIAEELNEEAILLWKATDSACRIAAKSMDLNHIFCEADASERKFYKIESQEEVRRRLGFGKVLNKWQDKEMQDELKKYWPIRESIWLSKICNFNFDGCLFVFGKDHYESFCSLLKQKSIPYETISCDWV